MLFECRRVGEVPTNTVESTKDDAKECEDNHAQVLVTLSGWWVKWRDDDSKDSGEDKGDEEEKGEEGEKDCDYEQKDEEADEESTCALRIEKLLSTPRKYGQWTT